MPLTGLLSRESLAYFLSSVHDHARSWFHIKVCLVAGTGFFTDA